MTKAERKRLAAARAAKPKTTPRAPFAKASDISEGDFDGIFRLRKSDKSYIDIEDRYGNPVAVSIWTDQVSDDIKPGQDVIVHVEILPATEKFPNEFVNCDVCLKK